MFLGNSEGIGKKMSICTDEKGFSQFKPHEFSYLKSLHISKNLSGGFGYEVEIVLSVNVNESRFLRIQAKGVFDLKTGNFDDLGGVYADVNNVLHHQIENAAFHICDCEHDTFSFYCKTFIAEVL